MRILIISEFIAPYSAIASIRWTKLGKYLAKEHDCTVDILTNEKDFRSKSKLSTWGNADETLAPDLKWFNEIHAFKDSFMVRATNLVRNTLWSLMSASRTSPSGAERPKSKARKQNPGGLINKAYPAFLKLREGSMVRNALNERLDWGSYDVIVSSFSPKWTHLVARAIKKEHPRVLWIADYRDALAYSSQTLTEENKSFAGIITGQADCITSVSERTLHNLFLPPKIRSMVLPNGFDPEETQERKRAKAEKFFITYTGTLYNSGDSVSNLKPLFRAVEALISESKMDPVDIEFVYCGMSEQLFIEQATLFPAVPWKNLGRLSRKDALALQERSSLLALCIWNTTTSQGIVTGKVFEYFTSSVPIACLCSGNVPDSQLKQMLQASRTGYCYEEASHDADFAMLKAFVYEKYTEWVATGLTSVDADEKYIRSFGYDDLATDLFEEIIQLQQSSKKN